ncbi:MAG TPA: hypothetical protein H9896_06490, partial [Candidatus Pygmaiobacter gallistercoris]|nr:hypothetical protein [Candidatus Pygmaiobacter gallistercoris]
MPRRLQAVPLRAEPWKKLPEGLPDPQSKIFSPISVFLSATSVFNLCKYNTFCHGGQARAVIFSLLHKSMNNLTKQNDILTVFSQNEKPGSIQ